MARTKSFKLLVQQHVKGDAKFAEALLREGIDAMLSGYDLATPETEVSASSQQTGMKSGGQGRN